MHAEKMQLEGYQYQEWPAQHEPVPLPPVNPEDPAGADPEWDQEEEDEQEHEEEEEEEDEPQQVARRSRGKGKRKSSQGFILYISLLFCS